MTLGSGSLGVEIWPLAKALVSMSVPMAEAFYSEDFGNCFPAVGPYCRNACHTIQNRSPCISVLLKNTLTAALGK